MFTPILQKMIQIDEHIHETSTWMAWNRHQLMIHLEPNWPLFFWDLQPSKKKAQNSNQNKGPHLGSRQMGVSKIGVPQIGCFIMENPIKMDDLGVPAFKEPPKY